jgi:hypothetical protein
VQTNAYAAAAWQEQQDLWVQLHQAAPDLAPHSSVFFVLPAYTDRFGFVNYRRSPLLDSHDVTMALRVLYGDDTLSGDVLYPDVERTVAPVFAPQGIVHWWRKDVTPYEQAVVVAYHRQPRRLQVVLDLPLTLDLGFAPSTYQPADNIRPQQLSKGLRSLIQS